MQEFLSDKKNLVIVLVVLVVLLAVSLFMSRRKEGFDRAAVLDVAAAPAQPASAPAQPAAAPVQPAAQPVASPQAPQVNVTVGTLADGPGAERGPVPVLTGVYSDIPDSYYFLDDGAGGEMSVQNNLCSKSCCSAQWPTPFKQKSDPYVCEGLKSGKYVPSRQFCNNTYQDAGCLCLTKEQGRFLYNRGLNGSEWF